MIPVTVIAGPTASGKSAYALGLARERPCLIINGDSMQLYRDLPILAAQPSRSDQDRVPHALYGVLSPDRMMNASDWAHQAAHIIAGFTSNDARSVVIVGGTGFYLKALIDGLSPMPAIDPSVRADLRARTDPTPTLHAELAQRDPAMAQRIRHTDRQRILRALEIVISSGRSLAEWQAMPHTRLLPQVCFRVIRIMPTPTDLAHRIKTRLENMLDAGLVAEIDDFCARVPNALDLPIARMLGFRTLVAMTRGLIDPQNAFLSVAHETRQYAKRQLTWLRTQITPSDHCIIDTSSAVK